MENWQKAPKHMNGYKNMLHFDNKNKAKLTNDKNKHK